jgi:hypothetical protein
MNRYRLRGMNNKYLFGTTAIMLLLGAGAYMYLSSVRPSSDFALSPQEKYIKSENEKSAALEEAYKNDPYGGSTPEETLQMYIEALGKGDIEMAVNLFAVEDREKAFDRLSMTMDNGNLTWFADVLRNKNGVNNVYCSDISAECSVTFYSNEKEQIHFEKMKRNGFSLKWKLREDEAI